MEESISSLRKRKDRVSTSKCTANHWELKKLQNRSKKNPIKTLGKVKIFNKLKNPNEKSTNSDYVMKEPDEQNFYADILEHDKNVDLRAKLSKIGQRSKKNCPASKYEGLIESINETSEKKSKDNFSEKLKLTVNIASIHELPNGHGEVKDSWQKSVVIPHRQFALKVANLYYDTEKMEDCHQSLNSQMKEMYGLIDGVSDRIQNQEDTVQKLLERVSALETLTAVQTDKININQRRLLDLLS